MAVGEEALEDKPSMVKIFTSPTETFEQIRKRPVFWGALFIGAVLTYIGMWLSLADFDPSQIPELEGLTKEEEAAFIFLAKVTYVSIGILGPVAGILMSTIVYFLVGRIVESDVTFKQVFSMNTYIALIVAAGVLFNGLLASLFNDDSERGWTNLGALIKVDGSFGIILSNIEVFSLWSIGLTALGLQKVVKVPKGLAWGIAVIFFVMGMIMAVAGVGAPEA